MSITASPSSYGYDPWMALVNRFVHTNGKSVSVHRTPSGITAYVADEIPLEALIAWRAQLSDELGLPPRPRGQEDDPHATPGARDGATG